MFGKKTNLADEEDIDWLDPESKEEWVKGGWGHMLTLPKISPTFLVALQRPCLRPNLGLSSEEKMTKKTDTQVRWAENNDECYS